MVNHYCLSCFNKPTLYQFEYPMFHWLWQTLFNHPDKWPQKLVAPSAWGNISYLTFDPLQLFPSFRDKQHSFQKASQAWKLSPSGTKSPLVFQKLRLFSKQGNWEACFTFGIGLMSSYFALRVPCELSSNKSSATWKGASMKLCILLPTWGQCVS